MKSFRASAVTAFSMCMICCASLHAQERSQQDTIAVVNFGVNNPKYKSEAKRIPDALRAILEKQAAVRLIGTEEVTELLMEASQVLDVFETDSAYWNGVGALTGADVIVHGLVKPQNDTTMFVDLFVSELASRHVYKTALLYNPEAEKDQRLGERLRRIVDDLILSGRTSKPVVGPAGAQDTTTAADSADSDLAPRQGTALPVDADEHASFRWLIGGAAIVAAAVTVFVLMADAVEPSDHNLPAPPSFP